MPPAKKAKILKPDAYDTVKNAHASDGSYKRTESRFKPKVETLELDQSTPGRYHLHVALACPWADGALSVIFLKGLEDYVTHSVTHPTWQRTRPDLEGDVHTGWVYAKEGDKPLSSSAGHGSFDCDGCIPPAGEAKSIRDLYVGVGEMDGPFTTPVLFDKQENKIVSNESTVILRILNDKFNKAAKHPDLNLCVRDWGSQRGGGGD
jgi:putative glutathione S-transferase